MLLLPSQKIHLQKKVKSYREQRTRNRKKEEKIVR